jgi:hypothetical protein
LGRAIASIVEAEVGEGCRVRHSHLLPEIHGERATASQGWGAGISAANFTTEAGAATFVGSWLTEGWEGLRAQRLCGFLFYRTRRGLRFHEAGRAKERAAVFARPVNDSLVNFLVVEKRHLCKRHAATDNHSPTGGWQNRSQYCMHNREKVSRGYIHLI